MSVIVDNQVCLLSLHLLTVSFALVQIAHLPHVDPGLEKNARAARAAMDRPPISELFM
jgi:hypothetical protein